MFINVFVRGSRQYKRAFFCALGVVTMALCVMVQACSPAADSAIDLRITGSSTVAPVMAEIVKRYSIYHPDATIAVSTGGSNQGIEDVRQGTSSIGMVSRSLKPEEEALESFTIALDGVSLLVHQNNPVAELSKQQVADIYTGKLDSWQEINAQAAPITVLSKTQNHATLSLFADYFEISPDSIQADRLLGDNQEMMQAVSENPNAVGYVSIGAAEQKMIHGMPLKLLPLEGVAATIQNVGSGDFPLARPLNLVTSEFPQGIQKELIEFALSAEVKHIIQDNTFVPAIAK